MGSMEYYKEYYRLNFLHTMSNDLPIIDPVPSSSYSQFLNEIKTSQNSDIPAGYSIQCTLEMASCAEEGQGCWVEQSLAGGHCTHTLAASAGNQVKTYFYKLSTLVSCCPRCCCCGCCSACWTARLPARPARAVFCPSLLAAV